MQLVHELVRVSHFVVKQIKAARRAKRDATVYEVGMFYIAGRGRLTGSPPFDQPGDRGVIRVRVA
jgi:hypothetical protein